MRRILLLMILSSLAWGGFAQSQGTLNLKQDSRIDRLMQKQREVYANNKTMNGFRVQIFMEIGNEAVAHARSVKGGFEKLYPEIPVYLSYEQPYYRLRVGDFRNRVEAEKYLRILKPRYSLAFVTADIINPPQKLSPVDLEELMDDGEETGDDYED
jgi:hypothetical protein